MQMPSRTQNEELSRPGMKSELDESGPSGLQNHEFSGGVSTGADDLPAAAEKTLAFQEKRFFAGFRNNGMIFTWFVMEAVEYNFTSLLLESLNWKDLFGRSRHWNDAPHALLFDVEHWNSFYPLLPRLIPYNAFAHPHFDPVTLSPTAGVTVLNATSPYFNGSFARGWEQYRDYTRRVLSDPVRFPRSPIEIAMMKGAFRPSPDLQRHIDQLTDGAPYLALHARVEPDMQKHPFCLDLRVLLLSDIIQSLESHFPRPAFDRVFVAINRPMLEDEVATNLNNTIAVDNLCELNRIRDHGLWNGTVGVFEAGASYMRTMNASEDELGRYAGISGAVMDYFLAVEASTFVGAEVSSFTLDLIQTRFFRSNRRNYFYRPDGLHRATSSNATQPPRFGCFEK
jgi:hypothetical protein